MMQHQKVGKKLSLIQGCSFFFFFFQFCECSHIGDHPQEELAKFWLQLREKSQNKFLNPAMIWATCLNLLSKYDNFRK
jgi:hypothetical protein